MKKGVVCEVGSVVERNYIYNLESVSLEYRNVKSWTLFLVLTVTQQSNSGPGEQQNLNNKVREQQYGNRYQVLYIYVYLIICVYICSASLVMW